MYRQKASLYFESMSVFRGVTKTPLFSHIQAVTTALEGSEAEFCNAYGTLCQYILSHPAYSIEFQNALWHDDNSFARASRTQSFSELSPALRQAAEFDLRVLGIAASFSSDELLLSAAKAFPRFTELWEDLPTPLEAYTITVPSLFELYTQYTEHGYGFFAQANAFRLTNGIPEPLLTPEKVLLSDLKGYTHQKEAVLANTASFLRGQEANHVLLYGDKGTGKSSLVKAVSFAYADEGLKVIELTPQELIHLPRLCEYITESPFYFLIFLDDISFQLEDERFTMLKAFLEGTLLAKPKNLLVYATSNRRHLVAERLSDRQTDDEVHRQDALETAASLADRFGLVVTFTVPSRDGYWDIVTALAAEHGISLPEKELHMLAERFALGKGGRSPRVAKQFVLHQLAQMSQENASKPQ